MLLPSVVEKIFLGTSTKQLSIKEIPDLDIQLKLQRSISEYCWYLSREIWLWCYQICYQFYGEECIYTANYSTFLLFNVLREIQDFRRGLEQHGLYSILSEHFAHASKEFSLSQGITSTEIIKLFKTVLYSDASANDTKKKNLEEHIFYYFSNFVEVFLEGSKVMIVFDVYENRETKVSKHHTSAWVLAGKLATYFQNTFFQEHLWWAASVHINTYCKPCKSLKLGSSCLLIIYYPA